MYMYISIYIYVCVCACVCTRKVLVPGKHLWRSSRLENPLSDLICHILTRQTANETANQGTLLLALPD